MKFFNSIISAFAMYSRIPVPKIKWCEENRRYALGFFPLVGAVSGLMMVLWYFISDKLGINTVLFSAVCTAIPIVVTGGIHMDGFCDVIDAKSSYGNKEKRLEIMSDPHTGAFAVIYAAIYFLVQTGLFSEVRTLKTAVICGLIFVISRTLSGFAAVTLKNAKGNGTLYSFTEASHRKSVIAILAVIFAVCTLVILFISPVYGLAVIVVGFLTFFAYKRFAYKNFGGITGDLEGYFLQICEIAMLAAAVIIPLIWGKIKCIL